MYKPNLFLLKLTEVSMLSDGNKVVSWVFKEDNLIAMVSLSVLNVISVFVLFHYSIAETLGKIMAQCGCKLPSVS